MPVAPSTRAYAAAHFALELDGQDGVGLFRSIEGGSIRADVMTYQNGSNYDRWRQLGKPKFEDIKLQVGMAMSGAFINWIRDFFLGNAVRKTGAIVAADFYYNERARRHFDGAMIKELTFPKLDGSDKNAAYMTIGISVEDMTFLPGTGKKLAPPAGFDAQKVWTACNFSFELKGFEAACKRVTKIDSFTIKQNVIEHHVGGVRAPIKVPSQVDFPNLTFYVPEADAAPFQKHAEERSVRAGKLPAGLTGALHVLDSAGKDLFQLSFAGADIIGVTPDKSDSSTEEIKLVKVEIYTEKMKFEKYVGRVDTIPA
jgi:phage tail-like protein